MFFSIEQYVDFDDVLCYIKSFPTHFQQLLQLNPQQAVPDITKNPNFSALFVELKFMKVIYHYNSKCNHISPSKVVLIGKENVGKTAIKKNIINDWGLKNTILSFIYKKGERISTDGIEMVQHTIDQSMNIQCQLWDFAGQQTYYTTHQFFLSKGALHVIVFKMVEDISQIKKNILPWWNSIQAKVSGAKVVMIGTFLDQIPKKNQNQRIQEISDCLDECYQNWCSMQVLNQPLQLCYNSVDDKKLSFFPGIYFYIINSFSITK